MTQTPDYKRGYAKGYNTGRGEQSAIERRHQDELLAVAQRAERAEAANGIGHCDDCQHWSRPSPVHAWGVCGVKKAPGTPYGCWVQALDTATYRDVQISTSPKFGCVLFFARATEAGVPSPVPPAAR